MNKYIISALVALVFIIGIPFIGQKAFADNMSIRDFVNLLIAIGVVTPDKIPAVNVYLASLDKTSAIPPTPSTINTIKFINETWQSSIIPSATEQFYLNGYIVYLSPMGAGGCGRLPNGTETTPCPEDFIGISSNDTILAPAFFYDEMALDKYIHNNVYLFADISGAQVNTSTNLPPLGVRCLITVKFTSDPLNPPYTFPVQVKEMKCE